MSFSNNKCGHGKSINEHCEPCKKLYGSLDDRHELKAKLAEAVEVIQGLLKNIDDYIDNDDAACLRQWRKDNEIKARAFLEKYGVKNG